MDEKKIKDYLKNLDYGPAPESAEPALSWLAKHNRQFGHFIGGEEVMPTLKQYFATINPASGEHLANVAYGTVEDVDMAMRKAVSAFPLWASTAPVVRMKYMYALARTMEKYQREAHVLEALNNGKSFRETRDIDIPLAIRHFRYHAGWAMVASRDYPNYKPGGVVGQIIPWNFPLLMLSWKIAPAIAVGNTVVLKPAEYTPLSALWFADIVCECGIPPGVINIVTGDGKTGEAIVSHSTPWMIQFTGSTEVGRKIRLATAPTQKRLTMELGGKSPFIVFADADLDSAVEGMVRAIWFNQGQVCSAGSRLLVEESCYDQFIKKVIRRMNLLRGVSPGITQLDKAIDMGAINSKAQLSKIRELCESGVREGATIHQTSCATDENGFFFPPTLFTDVSPSMRIAQEEIFGPVLVAMSFRTPQEAIDLANNTPYGLAASVWSSNIEKAVAISRKLVVGTVWVNDTNMFDAASGFGGERESGFGREGGREGIVELLQERHPESIYHGMFNTPGMYYVSSEDEVRREERAKMKLDRTFRFLIGGKLARPDGQNSFRVYSPSGRLIAVCADANRKDIRNAVREARKALLPWAEASADLKAKILGFVAENVDNHRRRLVGALMHTGSPKHQAQCEVDAAVDRLLYYAARADKYEGTIQPVPYPISVLAVKEPRGVVGVRAPDDFPLLGFVSAFAPLYVMGNSVIMIAGKNPLPALELLQILQASETPASTVNIVTALDPDAAVNILAEHKDVDSVWCFSSEAACTAVKASSISNMKHTFTSNGEPIDWFGKSGEADEFLRAATTIKNIWIPSGY